MLRVEAYDKRYDDLASRIGCSILKVFSSEPA